MHFRYSGGVERRHLGESFSAERFDAVRFETVDEACLALIEREPDRFFAYLPPDPGTRGEALQRSLGDELKRLWEQHEEYAYSLVEKESARLLGHVSVHAIKWSHHCCELAYWIRSDAAGRGYVSEAVRAAERFLFATGFHRIEIRCDTLNKPSAAVAQRCGYTLDGTLRQHMRRADGTYRDSLVYGKLNEP